VTTLKQKVMQRALEPAAIRFFQWRGDPLARMLHASTKVDPYPLWADLRERGLIKSPLGAWMTASHPLAAQVLLDRKFSPASVHRPGYAPTVFDADDPRANVPDDTLLTLDPPDHTRIRRLVSSAFSPRAIAALEPWIRDQTRELLDRTDPTGFDLIDAVAMPLPIAVICRLLGVPQADEADFRVWGHDVVAMLDGVSDADRERVSGKSERALVNYLKNLVAERRTDPDDSLLSALIAVEEEGDRLSSGELVSTALLLLLAGFETTVNLIGNGTVALIGAPDQWHRLREDPGVVANAVEELLRYDSPVQATSRTATEDLALGDKTIRRGETVIVAIGGANRDGSVFARPDELAVDRADASKHLAFSYGIHHCLGAALARLEGRVVFEEMTRHFESLELTAPPTHRTMIVLRGYEHIPLRARGAVNGPI
jgi:cytochrome P450